MDEINKTGSMEQNSHSKSITHKIEKGYSGNTKVLTWSIIVSLGGFLFGFDTAVISGVEKQIQELFSLVPSSGLSHTIVHKSIIPPNSICVTFTILTDIPA